MKSDRSKMSESPWVIFMTKTLIFHRWSFLLHMKACIHPHPHPVLRHGPKDGQSQSAYLTLLLEACTTELPSYFHRNLTVFIDNSIVTLRCTWIKKNINTISRYAVEAKVWAIVCTFWFKAVPFTVTRWVMLFSVEGHQILYSGW